MSKIAFLFPGQGSQFLGMGRDLFTNHSSIREIFDAADETAKMNISKLCFNGPLEELTQTIYLQPAITAVNLAFLSLIEKEGINCNIAMGHSLGEYSALKAAKVLSLSDTMKTVFKRGSLMNREASKAKGIMCSIIGLDFNTVEAIVRQCKDLGIVSIANHNAKHQIVISGNIESVNKAVRMLKLKSARIIPLNVSGAWHSALMKGMIVEFFDFLNTIHFKSPRCKVIYNVNCDTTENLNEIKTCLIEQICKPVLWFDSIVKIINEGVDVFVEIGPGKILNNLLKKTIPKNYNCKIFNTNDIKTLDKFLTYIL